MKYEYQVLPFRGQVESVDTGAVARQLNALINSQSLLGWEFYQINSVGITVSPGCIASLLGQKGFPLLYDMAIFRREISLDQSSKPLQQEQVSQPLKEAQSALSQSMPAEGDEAQKYGITFNGEKYCFKEYKYDKLEDAIAYAKKNL